MSRALGRSQEIRSVFFPVIERFSAAPRALFLLDGLGALLSAALLGLLLPRLGNLIGMPSSVLYPLAGAACLLSFTSLSCALVSPTRWRSFLFAIAGANLTYCALTLALLFRHRDSLHALDWIYFLGEMAIIVALASLEIAVARRPSE